MPKTGSRKAQDSTTDRAEMLAKVERQLRGMGAEEKREHTIHTYMHVIENLSTRFDMLCPDADKALLIIDTLRREGKKSSTLRYYTVIMDLWHRALNRGERLQVPKPKIKIMEQEREARRLTRAEATKLLHAKMPINHHMIVMLGLLCGLRRAEICAMRCEDIDLDHRFVFIRNHKDGVTKSGKERVVSFPKEYLGNFEEYVEFRKAQGFEKTDRLVINHYGKAFSVHGLGTLVPRIAEHAGIKRHISAHSMRATFASTAAENGVNLSVIKDLMGHAQITTTLIYCRHSPDNLRDAMDKVRLY